jgi:ABC-type branched-subunit amino acid transport system ATPase component
MGRKIQVVDGYGAYQEEAVLEFVSRHGLADAGVNYSTVAIMGAQSSGKSTLLNAVVCAYGVVVTCFDMSLQACRT